jgi:hypothetical protein
MSFFRHREIFRSDVTRLSGEQRHRRSPVHRLDEFPVGYSSASCTPAELASALPTGFHSATPTCRRQTSFQPMANCVLTSCAITGDKLRLNPRTLCVSSVMARVHRMAPILQRLSSTRTTRLGAPGTIVLLATCRKSSKRLQTSMCEVTLSGLSARQ